MTGKNKTHWKKCYLNHHESGAVFGNNDSCWEEWFHVLKCVLTSSKWFQTRCCPDRPCTDSKTARTHALTWSYALPNLKLHTTWSTEAAACQQHPWGLAAASFCQWLFFFFLFFWCIMQLRTKDSCERPAALLPPCWSLCSVETCTSTGKAMDQCHPEVFILVICITASTPRSSLTYSQDMVVLDRQMLGRG